MTLAGDLTITTEREVARYSDHLHGLWRLIEVTDCAGAEVGFGDAILQFGDWAKATHADGFKLLFVGNGGSSAIASHMAIDYTKNGGMRSLAFNDAASLTCLSNDLGYDQVFAKQITMHAREGDLLIAISSSGRSANIISAVEAARRVGCSVITLSGFGAENPLRMQGDLNFYVPSDQYGFVEISHLTVCHAALDLACGIRF